MTVAGTTYHQFRRLNREDAQFRDFLKKHYAEARDQFLTEKDKIIRDAIARLEVMISLANANMQMLSIRQQIASAVHLLVQAARLSDGSRRVINITEVTGMEGEVITLQDIFVFEKRGLSPEGKVMGRFAATGIRPKFADKLVAAGIRLSPDLFDQVLDV